MRGSLINYWSSLGISVGEDVLDDLGLRDAREIDLSQLSDIFYEQLSNCDQIIRYGLYIDHTSSQLITNISMTLTGTPS